MTDDIELLKALKDAMLEIVEMNNQLSELRTQVIELKFVNLHTNARLVKLESKA